MTTSAGDTLLGREAELAAIAELLDRARDGHSGAMALVGPAGAGKTRLLGEAARSASGGDPPLQALRVRGIESEAEIAFAGLLELVRPLMDLVPALPEPQARALEGALALAPAEATDRFSVAAATLAILALAAADGPVVVLVDDLHWLDPPSAQAILFAARRLWREGVAILASTRPEPDAVAWLEGIPRIDVGPLGAEDAARLARARAGRELAPAEVDALVVGTGGNPLAIIAAARDLDAAGGAVHGGIVPVAERIRVGVDRRLARLSPAERRAVLIAAAAGTRAECGRVQRALAEDDLTLDELDAAEREGLLRVRGDRIVFEHPLTRSAAYAAGSGEQRSAHRALARAHPAGSAERAWHLAAAAVAPDEEAAAALEEAGRDALARGAPSTALRAFDRAAALTADPEPAARRLLLCGDAARLAGEVERARDVVALALERTGDPLVRADALGLLFGMDVWRAPVATARTIAAEADRLEALDPLRSARMLAEAAAALSRSGQIAQGLEFAERAHRLVAAAGRPDETVELSLLIARLMDARPPEVVIPPLVALGERLRAGTPTAQRMALLQQVAWIETWVEQYEPAARLLEYAVGTGRGPAPGTLPMTLATRAELAYRRGRWLVALADTTEAASLGDAFGEQHARGLALTCQARIEACLGRDDDCRATAADAAAVGRALGGEESPIAAWGSPALGLLALGRGRPAEAVPHLERVVTSFRRGGIREPGVVLAAGDLVEAYVRTDRRDAAAALLEEYSAVADLTGRTGARAIAQRCRGLLAADHEAEEVLRAALALHDAVDMPFERARTHLVLGERLRRARRRADARVHLRAALAEFGRLGARHWAAIASRELEVTGETAAQRTGIPSDALTPQELQVALMVASGVTNREAGSRLFLSAKTVEAHLGRIYRKLGVRSRTELAARVAGDGFDPSAPRPPHPPAG